MDNENHKKTWNNFTKFVLWGIRRGSVSISTNGIILIVEISNEYWINFRKPKS